MSGDLNAWRQDIHDLTIAADQQPAQVEALREQYRNAETLTITLAQELRARQKTDPNHRDLTALRRGLQEAVASAFDIRVKLHLAEAEVLRSELQQIELTVKRRRGLRNKIVERRVEDLISGDELRWNGAPPATAAGPAAPQKDVANPFSHDMGMFEATVTKAADRDGKQAFHRWLTESLAQIHRQRYSLLEEITSCELALVRSSTKVEPPADPSREAAEAARQQQQRQDEQAEKLRQKIDELKAELAPMDEQVKLLEQRLRSLSDAYADNAIVVPNNEQVVGPVPVAPRSEKGEGRIVFRDGTQPTVWINLGSDDKIKPAATFDVYPQNVSGRKRAQRSGTIEVVRILDKHVSEARITSQSVANPIQAGHQIVAQ